MQKLLVLTYKPAHDLSNGEAVLHRMLDEFGYFRQVFTGWSCHARKGVDVGVPFVILQQGPYPHIIFAEGIVLGPVLKAHPPRRIVSDAERSTVPILIQRLVHPGRGGLYDEETTKAKLGRVNMQNSGVWATPLHLVEPTQGEASNG